MYTRAPVSSVLIFRAQGGRRVTAEVADANLPSRALLEKLGFSMGRPSEFKKAVFPRDLREEPPEGLRRRAPAPEGRLKDAIAHHGGGRAVYPSHIYQLTLEPLNITLGERTAESAARSFARMNTPAIRATLPLRARTAEEAAEEFRASQLPGASSFGRTILADGRHVGDVWCYGIPAVRSPRVMFSGSSVSW